MGTAVGRSLTTRTPPFVTAPRVASPQQARVAHIIAVSGIVLVCWLAFGCAIGDLGHRGDSWAYMSIIEQSGPFSILRAQGSRLALPIAWSIGALAAGSQPWIYHLLSTLFVMGSAICLYLALLEISEGAVLFSFAAAVLSVLWPSDPTRYDAATLGNRQALFLFQLGVLCYLRSLRSSRWRIWLGVGVLASTLSLLTYESQVLLVLAIPAYVLIRQPTWRSVQTRATVLAPVIAVLVYALVSAAATLVVEGHRTYQTELEYNFSAGQLVGQFVAGLRVLLIDAWTTPVQLLRSNAVPDIAFVLFATLLMLIWLGALLLWQLRRYSPELPRGATGRQLVVVGASGICLSLATFLPLAIPLSQPDRTQTFSMTWAAVLVCALLSLLTRALGRRSFLSPFLFSLACLPLVGLFASMASVYQRNFRDSWAEQRLILRDLSRVAPEILNGSLVVISGLPDSRIIFPSGYTCEFALGYIEGHPYIEPGARYFVGAEDIISRRVNCGLLFDGRNLDNEVHLEFTRSGVVDRFFNLEYTFPYDRVLLFRYVPGSGAQLADLTGVNTLGADVSGYNPRALIQMTPLRPEARRLLGD